MKIIPVANPTNNAAGFMTTPKAASAAPTANASASQNSAIPKAAGPCS